MKKSFGLSLLVLMLLAVLAPSSAGGQHCQEH